MRNIFPLAFLQFVGVISWNGTEVYNRKSRKRALFDLTNERAVVELTVR